ncbi:hypothetical protein GUJ93_ZPchr0001g31653 [Zizania palustris]|uniref:Uncharacterized protein n=1 Tax=Zizania palustris TaxID=103762 RepID=A0A8J5R5J9_ZIZPA|nr:hypothetical protein GUJ93_ZPchr0001g31653 [Zizania palustris]
MLPSCCHRASAAPPIARWSLCSLAENCRGAGASARHRTRAGVRWWRGQWPVRWRGTFRAKGSGGSIPPPVEAYVVGGTVYVLCEVN